MLVFFLRKRKKIFSECVFQKGMDDDMENIFLEDTTTEKKIFAFFSFMLSTTPKFGKTTA